MKTMMPRGGEVLRVRIVVALIIFSHEIVNLFNRIKSVKASFKSSPVFPGFLFYFESERKM